MSRSELIFIFTWIDRYLVTIAGALVSILILYAVPQTWSILWQLPGRESLREEKWMLGIYLYLIFCIIFSIVMFRLLVYPKIVGIDCSELLTTMTRKIPVRGLSWASTGLLILGFTWLLGVSNGWLRGDLRACHLLILIGVWLLWARYGNRDFDRRTDLTGRWLLLLLLAYGVGTLIWQLPKRNWAGEWVSYRAYTIWAIFHLVFLITGAAWVLDAWYNGSNRALRLMIAAALLAVLTLTSTHPVGQTMSIPPDLTTLIPDQIEVADLVPEVWFDALESRLNSLPEEGPVVFIAASGGGSRAALFTAMVLEGLETLGGTPSGILVPEESPPPRIVSGDGGYLAIELPHFTQAPEPNGKPTGRDVEIEYRSVGKTPDDPSKPTPNHIAVVRGFLESPETAKSSPSRQSPGPHHSRLRTAPRQGPSPMRQP